MENASNTIFLHFQDRNLEKEFRRFYEIETMPTIRLGTILSHVVLVVLSVIVFYFSPASFPFWLFIFSIILMYLAFVVYATNKEKYLGYYQLMAAIQNLIFGVLFLFLAPDVFAQFSNEVADSLILVMLFSCLLYCFYIFRLRLLIGIVASFSYLAAYQISLLWMEDSGLFIILSTSIWLIGGIVYFAGYIQEKTSRKVFLQQKEISEQRELLRIEGEKSESLLLNILPASIAQRLKAKQSIIADGFESTSVLFADIVGFTILSEKIPPDELVYLLNSIFSIFDSLTEKYKLEKIKTIGDAYMVAGGLPEPNGNHLNDIANLALDMQKELGEYNKENNEKFDVRIGIHVGPAVAGVIGAKKFLYDLWGDTVNTASRMESHGLPGEIQVTEQAYDLLKNNYRLVERGEIKVKGKGLMKTYFLKGKKL